MGKKFSHIVSLILTSSSAIFISGGFLYYKTFLNYFGIDSNAFFSLSDYMTASIDIVLYGILNVIVALIFIKLQMKNNWLSKLLKIFFILSIGLNFIGLMIVYYFPNSINLMATTENVNLNIIRAIGSSVYLMAYLLVPALTLKYCKDDPYTYNITAFIILFIITIPFYALINAYGIKTKNVSVFKDGEIKITTTSKADLSGFRIILANSNYYFMMNNENKTIIITPVNKIESIELVTS